MKSYTVTQRVYCMDAFEEDEIPEGMSPAQYAEYRYSDGYGDPDSHTLLVFEGDTIIYDGEDEIESFRVEAPGVNDNIQAYATSEDNNPEFWEIGIAEQMVWAQESTFIPEPREDNPSFGHWEPSFLDWKEANTCDECSELLLDVEDRAKCPDGKIRCITCVEAMYRENGGA